MPAATLPLLNLSVPVSRDLLRVPNWKRILDVGLIVVLSPLLVPLMALIALFIKLVSRGPVLFRQERLGHLRQPFVCLKFRTMAHGADPALHANHWRELLARGAPMRKLDGEGDARLIRFGGFLRTMGLDELPQLFNTLRGEMSLVGPRPCIGYELDNYHSWMLERFNVLPGLTGLWQVSGKNKTTFAEMVRLDVRYVRNQSPGMDLRIILRTVPTLLGQFFEALRAKWNRATKARRTVPSEASGGTTDGTLVSDRA